jgi:hypothetical protein
VDQDASSSSAQEEEAADQGADEADEADEKDQEADEGDEESDEGDEGDEEDDSEEDEDERARGRGRPRKKLSIAQRGLLELCLDVSRKHNLPNTATDDILKLVSLSNEMVRDHPIDTATAELHLFRSARVPDVVSFFLFLYVVTITKICFL